MWVGAPCGAEQASCREHSLVKGHIRFACWNFWVARGVDRLQERPACEARSQQRLRSLETALWQVMWPSGRGAQSRRPVCVDRPRVGRGASGPGAEPRTSFREGPVEEASSVPGAATAWGSASSRCLWALGAHWPLSTGPPSRRLCLPHLAGAFPSCQHAPPCQGLGPRRRLLPWLSGCRPLPTLPDQRWFCP